MLKNCVPRCEHLSQFLNEKNINILICSLQPSAICEKCGSEPEYKCCDKSDHIVLKISPSYDILNITIGGAKKAFASSFFRCGEDVKTELTTCFYYNKAYHKRCTRLGHEALPIICRLCFDLYFIGEFNCGCCTQIFVSPSIRDSHEAYCTQNQTTILKKTIKKKKQNKKKNSKSFVCEECDDVFLKKLQYDIHMARMHKEEIEKVDLTIGEILQGMDDGSLAKKISELGIEKGIDIEKINE